MSYEWLMAPHEYEPDYSAYCRDMDSLQDAMADVATYDDWFPEQHPDSSDWIGMGYSDPPPAPHGFETEIRRDSFLGIVTACRFGPVN